MESLRILLLALVVGLPAAGGAASAAGQHAKAYPVGHAKNCSVYGAGFRYVPGTDLCVKIGGWTGAQASGGGLNWGALNHNPAGPAAGNDMRARAFVTTDVREQTGYGPVRAYMSVGATHP